VSDLEFLWLLVVYFYFIFQFVIWPYHDRAHNKAVDDALNLAYRRSIESINNGTWYLDYYWDIYDRWKRTRGYIFQKVVRDE
jgi:ATP/ADP translocase